MRRFQKSVHRDKGQYSRKGGSAVKRAAPWLDGKTSDEFYRKVMKAQQRDNRGLSHLPKDLLEQGFLMLDSSYTQGADPNTMRDFGGTRNAVYNFEALTDPSARTSEQERSSRNASTQGYSPYKPAGMIGSVQKELEAREAILRKRCGVGRAYDFKLSGEPEDPYDEFYTVVKANDCTKNISEPLFSAGLVGENWQERTEQTTH